ncbi:hypothetical protein D8O27_11925 [Burkholderia mallei]|uniref:Membrane protein n=13 Tax=pseudomallei group TaxID=111527 RepID=Q63V65_BURPS|nr:hypothetical protein BMA0798 [Burkholderia mallei ATCC 23344]ABA50626.1 hypothetical protein BURPS1710b_1705 [Burkholderia pseudomallei 1710b]AUL55728.1 hypothetical protein BHT10_07385 [Burkholderia pseudomallei]KGS39320.1 putative membrane protein [Burkholderia pseudomallei ABCPW 107]KOS75975.1 putative membrane protein [Burkholderia mallei]MWX36149.1 hypothetical protein [Francisella tularensis]PNX02742.1 hypothetical protein CF649_14935 [Burkholderia sp. 136(2017)]PNX16506.1 hypotheti
MCGDVGARLRVRARMSYYVDVALCPFERRTAMDAESIAGLIGLGIGLLVLVSLSVYESREYKRAHNGEGMIHHWMAEHHLLDWRRKH